MSSKLNTEVRPILPRKPRPFPPLRLSGIKHSPLPVKKHSQSSTLGLDGHVPNKKYTVDRQSGDYYKVLYCSVAVRITMSNIQRGSHFPMECFNGNRAGIGIHKRSRDLGQVVTDISDSD